MNCPQPFRTRHRHRDKIFHVINPYGWFRRHDSQVLDDGASRNPTNVQHNQSPGAESSAASPVDRCLENDQAPAQNSSEGGDISGTVLRETEGEEKQDGLESPPSQSMSGNGAAGERYRSSVALNPALDLSENCRSEQQGLETAVSKPVPEVTVNRSGSDQQRDSQKDLSISKPAKQLSDPTGLAVNADVLASSEAGEDKSRSRSEDMSNALLSVEEWMQQPFLRGRHDRAAHANGVSKMSAFTRFIDTGKAASEPSENRLTEQGGAQQGGFGSNQDLRADDQRELEQIKLAMALSLKDSLRSSDQDEQMEQAQLAKAKQDSLDPSKSSGLAESMSWTLFVDEGLGFESTIPDGLYDVWGQFPEILEISPESGVTKRFPDLAELRQINYTLGDAREVIVVDRYQDEELCKVEWRAADAVSRAVHRGHKAHVQAILRVVIDSMGGQMPRDELRQRCWEETQRLKYSSGNLIIYIGQLCRAGLGTARHRALLFKTLADACRISCKITRGSQLRQEAVALVKIGENTYHADLYTGEIALAVNQSGQTSTPPSKTPSRKIPQQDSSRDISTKTSTVDAAGLDWQSELDEPILLSLESARLQEQDSRELNRDAGFEGDGAVVSTSQAGNAEPPEISDLQGNGYLYPEVRYFRSRDHAKPLIPASSDGAQLLQTDLRTEDESRSRLSSAMEGIDDHIVSPFQAAYDQRAGTNAAKDAELEELGGSFEFVSHALEPDHAHILPGQSKQHPIQMDRRSDAETQLPAVGCPSLDQASALAERLHASNSDAQPSMSRDSENKSWQAPATDARQQTEPLSEDASNVQSRRQQIQISDTGQSDRQNGQDLVEESQQFRNDFDFQRPATIRSPGPSGGERKLAGGRVRFEHDLGSSGLGGERDRVGGNEEALDLPAAERSRVEREEKAHWKLRQMSELRAYSETAMKLYAPERPILREQSALQERLDTLHELQGLQNLQKLQDLESAGSLSPARRHSGQKTSTERAQSLESVTEVPPAQPIGSVSSIPQTPVQQGLHPPDEFEISISDIKKGPRIGHGSFGVVYRGTWLETDVAIKELIVQDLYEDTDLQEEFWRETSIMKRLRHVNVLLFLGVVTTPPHMAIVTQYMRRGSLFRILHRSSLTLDSGRKQRMALDTARGMTYLHQCKPPIIHRDLKSDNLLVDHDFTVKVSDFGLSRVRRCTLLSGRSQAGTPHWTAPEVLRGQAYDESSDVYSFGVILWELLMRKPPWDDKTEIQVIGAVGFGHARLQLPNGTNPDLAAIILACWKEPKLRPTFKCVLESLKVLSNNCFDLDLEGQPTGNGSNHGREIGVGNDGSAAGQSDSKPCAGSEEMFVTGIKA